jgi:serine/threonine protein kinase
MPFYFQLHLHEHGIVHRDLAARNLLMSKDHQTIKVSDFGYARIMKHDTDTQTTTNLTGPVRWMRK